MADQLAFSIDNARLMAQSEAALASSRRAFGELTSEAWRELLRTRGEWGYLYTEGTISSVEGAWPAEMTQSLQTEQVVRPLAGMVGDGGRAGTTLSIPLRVRDQVVGVLGFRKQDAAQGWTDQEIEVLELLIEQLGDALVGAQLYEVAQENAMREQLVGDLATRMRQTLDVESVLRTAVQEVRATLDLPEVVVHLRTRSGDQLGGRLTREETR
jgi:GAF domain-containing protein